MRHDTRRPGINLARYVWIHPGLRGTGGLRALVWGGQAGLGDLRGAHGRLSWLAPLVEHWWILPLVACLCDYVENACHFHYLELHEKGKSPSPAMAGFCFVMTAVKTVAFGLAMAAVTAALLHAACLLVFHPREYGWRGLLALAVAAGSLLSAVGVAVWGWVYRFLSMERKPGIRLRTARHKVIPYLRYGLVAERDWGRSQLCAWPIHPILLPLSQAWLRQQYERQQQFGGRPE